jgi:hypothetical protein
MATDRTYATGGPRDRRPRRVRNAKTGHWLAKPVSAAEKPEWTKERAEAWLGTGAIALRQIDVLEALGIDAEME